MTSTPSKQRAPRYRFQRFLCSAGEWRFYQVLEEAFAERFDIMFQVRVAAILRPRSRDKWESHGRRVSQKAFDFVLLDKGTSRVRAAVELDDRSHDEPDRAARDQFLEAACKASGLPLMRVRVTRTYDARVLQEAFSEALSDCRDRRAVGASSHGGEGGTKLQERRRSDRSEVAFSRKFVPASTAGEGRR